MQRRNHIRVRSVKQPAYLVSNHDCGRGCHYLFHVHLVWLQLRENELQAHWLGPLFLHRHTHTRCICRDNISRSTTAFEYSGTPLYPLPSLWSVYSCQWFSTAGILLICRPNVLSEFLEVEVHDRGKVLQLEMAVHDKMREMGSVQGRQAVVAAEPAVVVVVAVFLCWPQRILCPPLLLTVAPFGSIPGHTVVLSRSAMPFLVNQLKWLI